MIKRSFGLPVTVANIPFVVGGGYEGKTKELDDTVKRNADLLNKIFKRDVEIRFNSDRNSGGAWVVNSLKGFYGNCQIGLNAGIVHCEDHFYHTKYGYPVGSVYIRSYLDETVLKHPEIATEGDSTHSKYHTELHKTLDDAKDYLMANIDFDKITK